MNSTLPLAERTSSASAAALSDKKLRQTKIAAAVGSSDLFGASLYHLVRFSVKTKTSEPFGDLNSFGNLSVRLKLKQTVNVSPSSR